MRNRALFPAVAVLGLLLFPVASAATTEICGDLDGSGTVGAADALRLLRFAVGQSVVVECPAAMAAVFCWDTNGNSSCDPAEDIDGDESCSVEDCRGPSGVVGTTFVDGEIAGVPDCSEPQFGGALGLTPVLKVVSGQKVILQGSAGLGTTVGATSLNIQLCRKDAEGAFTFIGNGVYGLVAAANTRQIYSLPAVFTAAEDADLQFGICACSSNGTGEDWDFNDYFAITAVRAN